MKTFKLKMLKIVEEKESINIPLMDGLIINREEDNNYWLIEAYMSREHVKLLEKLNHEKKSSYLLEVKITKESNKPAMFRSNLISINDIGENVNVIFQGTLLEN